MTESDEIENRVREVYDSQGVRFERATGSLDYFPGLAEELDRFFQRTVAQQGPILDLGAGVGRDCEYFLQRGGTVIAGDVSRNMLRYALERCKRFSGLTAIQLSMRRLPLADHSLGGVWLCASLLHLPQRDFRGVFHELHRTMRSGSRLSVSMRAGMGEGWQRGRTITEPRWTSRIEPANLELLLEVEGFDDITSAFSGRDDWYVTEATKI